MTQSPWLVEMCKLPLTFVSLLADESTLTVTRESNKGVALSHYPSGRELPVMETEHLCSSIAINFHKGSIGDVDCRFYVDCASFSAVISLLISYGFHFLVPSGAGSLHGQFAQYC